MKTKGNWVIKTSGGGYWCGNSYFDPQLRKAKIYHWKEMAEEQIEVIKKWPYFRDKAPEITFEVVAVLEPKELRDTEAEWIFHKEDLFYSCSYCGASALNDYFGQSTDSRFCPSCGKRMINSTMEDDE